MSGRFIGTWKLLSFEYRSDEDQVTYPFGKDPIGYLMYNGEGYMSVAFMASGRRSFSSSDRLGGTSEEVVAAYRTHSSYCGRYEVSGDRVVHLIEVSSYPNYVGQRQERFYRFEGDKLTLSTPPMTVNGRQQRGYLTWKKVK